MVKPAGFQEHLTLRAGLVLFLPFCSRSPFAGLALISAPLAPLSWLSAWSPAVLICRSCTAQQETVLRAPITAREENEHGDTSLKSKRSSCCRAKFTLLRTLGFRKGNLHKLKDKMKKYCLKTAKSVFSHVSDNT